MSGVVLRSTVTFQREVSHNREVIGGNDCLSGAAHVKTLERKPPVKIEMVKMQEGEHARVAPPFSGLELEVDAVVVCGHQAGSKPSCPFVEVTHHDAGPLQINAPKNAVAEQNTCLRSSLQESGA